MTAKQFFRLLIFVLLFSCKQSPQIKEEKPSKPSLKGFEMVHVKGGTFLMGGTDFATDSGPKDKSLLQGDECPHLVTVNDFSIGKYEVTQEEWKQIMGTNPSYFKNDRNPVEQVSWQDVQVFIGWLNAKYQEHYRLPTEEEWEYAARGGADSKDFRYAGSNDANEVAWWKGNSEGVTHEVGTLAPNELGIYDMSGNVWEWCSNWKASYPCNTVTQSAFSKSKVLRGGTFFNDSSSVRVRDRNGRGIELRLQTLGFRLAKSSN